MLWSLQGAIGGGGGPVADSLLWRPGTSLAKVIESQFKLAVVVNCGASPLSGGATGETEEDGTVMKNAATATHHVLRWVNSSMDALTSSARLEARKQLESIKDQDNAAGTRKYHTLHSYTYHRIGG